MKFSAHQALATASPSEQLTEIDFYNEICSSNVKISGKTTV
jgi:hypothetical protein